MKRKGQITALVTACMLALTACGGGSKETFADSARSTIAASAPAASTPAAEASDAGNEEMPDVLGTKDGNVYENQYFDLHWELPSDGWFFLDDEQLSQILQITQQVMDKEDLEKMLEQGGAYFDAYAMSPTNENVTITVQALSPIQTAVVGKVTEEALLSANGLQLQSTYKQMGATKCEVNLGTISFCGEEKDCMRVDVELMGTVMKQTYVMVMKGDYLMAITATTNSGKEDDLISSFTNAR